MAEFTYPKGYSHGGGWQLLDESGKPRKYWDDPTSGYRYDVPGTFNVGESSRADLIKTARNPMVKDYDTTTGGFRGWKPPPGYGAPAEEAEPPVQTAPPPAPSLSMAPSSGTNPGLQGGNYGFLGQLAKILGGGGNQSPFQRQPNPGFQYMEPGLRTGGNPGMTRSPVGPGAGGTGMFMPNGQSSGGSPGGLLQMLMQVLQGGQRF